MTKREWQEKFRDNLKSILEDRRMTQSDLARASNLSPSRISDYLKMHVMPNTYAVINMARALDIRISDLIDFGEPVN